MDEKKVREAIEYNKDFIEHLKDQIECLQKKDGNRILIATYQEQIKKCETIAEALEKQLPKKPKIYKEFKGEIDFDCPECGRTFLMEKADAMQCCPYCECRFDWSEQGE